MSSAIFQQVVDATRGEYVLHGTLGQSDVLGSAFLAREVATGRSMLLVVPPDAESLDVVAALSDGVTADAGGCAACGFRVGTWVDACPRCERSFLPPPAPGPDVAVLREQLHDSFEVVGSLPHVRGGTVYFGNDVADLRLAAFVVRPQADGQLALDVVWEAAVDAAPVPMPVAPIAQATPSYQDVNAHGANGGYGPATAGAPVVHAAPEVYAQPSFDPTPHPRRRWLPVGIGVAALAAVGAVAFALTRHPDPKPLSARPDSTATTTSGRPDSSSLGGPIGAGATGARTTGAGGVGPTRPDSAGTSVTTISRDSINAARLARRHYRDSVRAAQAQNAASLTIEGDLPTGWTRSINGGNVTSERQVPLTVGVPATIRLDAPGYCSDTLSVKPSANSRQHWAPTLRGRPTVGDC